jgi:hypothetical protein
MAESTIESAVIYSMIYTAESGREFGMRIARK